MKATIQPIAIAIMMAYCVQVSAQFSASVSSVPPCDSNGVITLTVNGGAGTYQYSIYGGALYETGTFTGTTFVFDSLRSGYYYLYVSDTLNNSDNFGVLLNPPFNLTITNITGADCPLANGSATVLVTGGILPYTYLWTNGETTPTAVNLTAGWHDVTVTDGNFCEVVYSEMDSGSGANIFIANNNTYNSTINTTPEICNSDGSAFATVTNSPGPFTYQWSTTPVQTTPLISNLPAGGYTVTITDAGGCSVVDYGYVAYNPVLNITGVPSSQTCLALNGAINITVSGGTVPYSYLWSNGSITEDISGIASGSYTVTVTDNNGCIRARSFNVNRTSPITLTSTATNGVCSVSPNVITTTRTGGAAPFTYLWSNGATTTGISGMPNGYYSVTVTDINGCSAVTGRSVGMTSPINPNAAVVNSICTANTGSITLNPTGGTAPYSYVWSSGATTASVSGLARGYYYFTITDNAGCVRSDYALVTNPSFNLNTNSTAETCGLSNGSVTASVSGGIAPFTYSWSTGATTTAISGLAGLQAYYVTVTDGIGCTASDGSYVARTGAYNASVSHTDETPSCSSNNGTATVNPTGGVAPFSYVWSNGQTTNTPTGLHAGFHSVTITDANGCSVIKNVTIDQPDLAVSVITSNATCYFDTDGSAIALASGGIGPYTYQWGDGQTSAAATGLSPLWPAGVRVTDAVGCSGHSYQNVGYNNLNCAVVIEGTLRDDVNGNCAVDPGEGVFENKFVYCSPDGGYTLTNAAGKYSFIVHAGTFTVEQPPFTYWTQNCPGTPYVLTFPTAGVVSSGRDFHNEPQPFEDLRVSMGSINTPVPGQPFKIMLRYFNDGLHTQSGTVTFQHDALLTLALSTPAYTAYNAATRTATFDFTGLAPNTSASITLDFGTVPTSVPVNTVLHFTASVTQVAGEIRPFNNNETLNTTVRTSYDPNMKEVTPEGTGLPGYISRTDSLLKYTIHFQNTGNYQAFEVAIVDTIDHDLDVTTILPGASSHAYRMQFVGDDVLRFIFSDINLPDSASNPEGSKGVVVFYVEQKPNLPNGTEIRNEAAIYFDYNVPVITNEVLNTILDTVSCLPPVASFTHAENELEVSLENEGSDFDNVLWNFGDGNTSTDNNPDYTYGADGNYTIQQIVSNQCGADTTSASIQVCAAPEFIIFHKGQEAGKETQFALIFSSGAATSYNWNFDDGSSATIDTPQHTYSTPGTYNVCATITNLCGDEETVCKSITMNVTSIAGIDDNITFEIYPNPTAGTSNVIFKGLKSEQVTLSVYSIFGQEISSAAYQINGKSTVEIDLGSLAPGVYSVVIRNKNELKRTVKLVKI